MKNRTIEHHCEFCLTRLGVSKFNIPKLSNRFHIQLMIKHKPWCVNWNDKAALIMGVPKQ